ncbi:MAG: 50S ribosomal protein L9 [Gemmatimonadota bacterium]
MTRNSEVILRAEVENLGHAGDVVEVAPGYARNYLFPRGLAYPASAANVHRVEQEKRKYTEKLAQEKVVAERLAESMAGITLEFQELAGEEDQLYGSVSSADIAEGLEAKGFRIQRTQIKLDPPIKRLGEYDVLIRLHPEVTVQVHIVVTRGTV